GSLCFILIVSPTAKPHALDRGSAAEGHRIEVIEFEESPRLAAAPLVAHEGALATIPLPDRPPDVGRDVALAVGRLPRSPRPRGGSELPLLELGDQGIEGSIQNLGDLARGQAVTQ